jgi:thiol-disulfide isomerase/thioredoxin
MGSTLQAWDPRLPENELVYGIETGDERDDRDETRNRGDSPGTGKAYPVRWLRERKGIVNDAVGGVPVVVVARGPLDVVAFDRRVGGRPLTFRPPSGSQAVMNDEETKTDWSGQGEALSGPLQGQRLKEVDGYVVEWHVWSAYHPGAELAGAAAANVAATVPEGLTFPPLTLPGLDGRMRPLTFPAAVNIVVLWAAWCPSCAAEMREIDRLFATHGGRVLSAVGIAIHIPDEDERAAVQRFVSEWRLHFPTVLVDEAAYDRLEAFCRQAGGPGLVLPTVFLTDDRGKVLAVLRGKDVDGLEGRLRRALQDVLERPTAPIP